MAFQPGAAPRHKNAVFVDRNDILHTGGLQHTNDGRTGRAGAVLHNADAADVLAHHLQRVEHTGQHDDGCAVLVVVENRDVQVALQLFLDGKAFGAADVLQVDAAEGRCDGLDGRHDLLLCAGVQADRESIDAAKFLKQRAFAFHDRQPGLGADISQAQHRGAVGHDRHRAPFERVFVDIFRVFGNMAAGLRHAGGVGGGERVPVLYRDKALHRQLSAVLFVHGQSGGVVIHKGTSFRLLALFRREVFIGLQAQFGGAVV